MAAALLLTAGCIEPPPQPVNSIHAIDTAKLTAVEIELKHDPILAGCVIKVSAQNDLVVLDGKVPTPQSKDKAEALARKVDGITKVANHLVVVPEEQPQPQNDNTSF